MTKMTSNCAFALLMLLARSSCGKNLPALRLLSHDRLLDGTPQISVTFPDGYSDNLLLKKHSDDHCHYIGHLEHEKEACVAVTGCLGQEDLELTVLSEHLDQSPMMRWKLDGSVEVIESREKIIEDIDSGKIIKEDKKEAAAIKKIEEKCRDGSCEDKIARSHTLEYRILYDELMVESQKENVEKDLRAAMVHAQAMYCHSSLGVRIELKELSVQRMTGMRFWENKEGERAWQLAHEHAKGADLVLQFAGCSSCESAAGWAPGWGTICGDHDEDRWAYAVWHGVALTGQIIAHEIGHNFGFANEGKECQVPIAAEEAGYGNIMASGHITNRAWSNCSRAVFEAYYLRNKDNWCLPAQNKNICDLTSPDTDSHKYLGCYEGPDWMIFLGANGFGFSAKDCLRLAKYSGKPYKLIGITDYQCYGSLLEAPKSKPLPSEKCLGQRGYGHSVGLYKVLKAMGSEEFESLGCWADKRMLGQGPDRALEVLLKYKDYGISAHECLDIVLEENKRVNVAKGKKPYVFFGVQDGHECWATTKTEPSKSYEKYGSSDKCKNGRGGPWANSVYTFKKD